MKSTLTCNGIARMCLDLVRRQHGIMFDVGRLATRQFKQIKIARQALKELKDVLPAVQRELGLVRFADYFEQFHLLEREAIIKQYHLDELYDFKTLPSGQKVALGKRGGRRAFFDLSGQQLFGGKWFAHTSEVHEFEGKLRIWVLEDRPQEDMTEKYCLYDENGEDVGAPGLHNMVHDQEDVVCGESIETHLITAYKNNGTKVQMPHDMRFISRFYDGVAFAQDDLNQWWRLSLDGQAEKVYSLNQVQHAWPLMADIWHVRDDRGRYRLINARGESLYSGESFENITKIGDYIWAQSKNSWFILDRKLQLINTLDQCWQWPMIVEAEKGLVHMNNRDKRTDEKISFFRTDGTRVTKDAYFVSLSATRGMTWVKTKYSWFVMDTLGDRVPETAIFSSDKNLHVDYKNSQFVTTTEPSDDGLYDKMTIYTRAGQKMAEFEGSFSEMRDGYLLFADNKTSENVVVDYTGHEISRSKP